MGDSTSAAAGGVVCAVGLDGCRAGWVGALAYGRPDSVSRTRLQLFQSIRDLIDWRQRHHIDATACIDVPIGLPPVVGLRRCDREARHLLGRRWMCVFEPPDRELLGLDFYAAREIVRQRRAAEPEKTFHALSQQAAQITPKINEVDQALRQDPSRQAWLVEVHPEVSFRELAGADLPPKKTRAGKQRRLALLQETFPDVEQQLQVVTWRRRNVAYDDMLDAYAALWSNLRHLDGCQMTLGGRERDEHGLHMRMIV